MKQPVDYIWGKSTENGDLWLPVWLHLRDTYGVSGWLWDNVIPQKHKNILMSEQSMSDAEAKTLLQLLAGLHDVGKASPDFSGRESVTRTTAPLYHRMVEQGFPYREFELLRKDTPIRHEVSSAFLLDKILDFDGNEGDCFLTPIAGHHGAPRRVSNSHYEGLTSLPEMWGMSAKSLIDFILSLNPDSEKILDQVASDPLGWRSQILLSGWVVCSDWLASNDEFFPLLDFAQVPEMAADYDPDRLPFAINKFNMPEPFDPSLIPDYKDHSELFAKRFNIENATLRPIQKSLLEVVSNPGTDPEDVFVLEAPMGEGKTEAALLAAEILMKRSDARGMYFGLPTMATSEALYGRFVPYLRSLLEDSKQQAPHNLAHSKSFLSEAYKETKIHTKTLGEHGISEAGWYTGRYTGQLIPFTVGTVDNFLMLSLKTKYSYWRHLGFSQKVIIIDEVHSMDEHMEEYLKRSLRYAGIYGCPVLLLSATLHPKRRDEFVAAYNEGKEMRDECRL